MAKPLSKTEFIWHNGSFLPWDQVNTHVLTHGMHYGAGVFEGIRCYDTADGTAIFRLSEHVTRLFYSAAALGIKIPFSAEILSAAMLELLTKNKLRQGYIRPIVFYSSGFMGVNPAGVPVDVSIACWPWGAYLPEGGIDVKVVKVRRIHPGTTVCDAKICGHYINSIFAVLELSGSKYQEALLLDHEGNVAEGPAENFFMVEGGAVITPPKGSILLGITRATIMELARDLGYAVREEKIDLNRVLAADEAFFTGTAVEVAPVRSINDKILKNSLASPIGNKLKRAYEEVVYGRDKRYSRFLSYTAPTA